MACILSHTRRPANKEELFNLRHASACNIIERIFGVIKRRFRILLLAPEYSMAVQARIPTALCAIHNFIRTHDAVEGELPGDVAPLFDNGHDEHHLRSAAHVIEQPESSANRDRIASLMWEDYQRLRMDIEAERENDEDEGEPGEGSEDEEDEEENGFGSEFEDA
jgi:hypothetical protein